jgi:hypothetical protein
MQGKHDHLTVKRRGIAEVHRRNRLAFARRHVRAIDYRADIAAAAMLAPQPGAEIDEGQIVAVLLGQRRQIGGREHGAI